MKLFTFIGQVARKALYGLIGIVTLASVAYALTIPATFPPRQFNTQQTHYIRFLVQFNSCVLAGGSCSYKVGALPYNAFVIRAYQQITTSFNSGTTDTLALGTSSGGVNLVAAQSVHGAAGGATTLTIVSANAGITGAGDGPTPSGADGGFDVYVPYAQTGAVPPAGQAVIIVEYFGANDGNCITPPLGSLPSAVGGTNAC